MKTVRLYILFFIGIMSGMLLFSFVAMMEEGKTDWMALAGAAIGGILVYQLGRYWDRQGKLPEEATNRNNDKA